MRKFLFNTSIVSAIFSAWSTVQATRRGPRDWRLALLWVVWAANTAIAVGTVLEQAKKAKR